MNPIAFGMIILGLLLMGVGLFFMARHRKAAGVAVCLVGIGLTAVPFIVTFWLLR